MLERIEIRNFKCLRDVQVDLTPFTVLIGPNDSGKSSFLSCISSLGELSKEVERQGEFQNITALLQKNSWRLGKDAVSLSGFSSTPIPFSISLEVTPNTERRVQSISVGDSEQVTIGLKSPSASNQAVQFRNHKFNPMADHPLLDQLIKLVGGPDLLQIRKTLNCSQSFRFNPSEMRKPAEAESKPLLSASGDNLAAVVNALLTGPDRRAVTDLEESLHRAVPSLRGISTPSDVKKNSQRVLEFALSGDERPPITISAKQVSDGALFLTAFLALIHSQSKQILLIEEPENGLHPSRLKMVVDLLKKLTTGELGYPPRQIVLTTHSPLLLNYVEPQDVRIFQRGDDDSTTVTRMDSVPEIDRLLKEFSPGELWFLFGEEALVKGPQ